MLFSFIKKQAFSALLIFSFATSSIYAQNRVAIVGGGMAGVATAHYLIKENPTAKITVFEKKTILGGNAHTIETLNEQEKNCLSTQVHNILQTNRGKLI